ncbi:MAG TPA: DUF2171 domain-containing protein [Chloroflexota bacterium]|nr:DUF2171 domain-containing protein [Chloroflexota bacterium]
MHNLRARPPVIGNPRSINGAERRSATETPGALASIEPGSPVFCARGTDVGRVAAVLPDGFILERGSFLERQTYRIPARAIERTRGIRVILNVECADLEEFRSD